MTKSTHLAAAAASGGAAEPLRDIKPPVHIPNAWIWIWIALGALAGLCVLFLAWRLWQKRRTRPSDVPSVPAHVRARQRLEAALALLGDPKAFCTQVSDTIRWYLEERFEFRAPERTTEEFLHELQGTDLLLPDQKDSLGEFLKRCDLVKFARYEPSEAELRDLHGSALRLVEETEPPAAPPTPAESVAVTP